eukprot:scaffold221_cov122-Isochrysis_galbana.AAC.2
MFRRMLARRARARVSSPSRASLRSEPLAPLIFPHSSSSQPHAASSGGIGVSAAPLASVDTDWSTTAEQRSGSRPPTGTAMVSARCAAGVTSKPRNGKSTSIVGEVLARELTASTRLDVEPCHAEK